MKKRMLAMLLCMSMVLSLFPMAALAADEDDTIVSYAVEDGNIYFDPSTGAITDCDQSVTSADIPDSINGAAVTSIDSEAFEICENLISVTIPDSVTTIGSHAFYYCTSLTSVTIPDSVTIIGFGAFRLCTSLTSVTIPDGVTTIYGNVFMECRSLTSVTIPDSVTRIAANAFFYCISLTSVTIPDSVTRIDDAAFASCSSLTDVYYDGTEEEWNNISVSDHNTCLTDATIHFNSTGPEDEDNSGGSVRYFSEWDAENQIAYFADMNIPLGAAVTEETDTSFIENIDSLLGQCVLVKTKSRADDQVGPDILLSISPVETRRGTVTDVDDSSITIDGVSYSLSKDWFWAKFYVGAQVIYYLSGSDIVGIEELETLTGTLISWNAETGKISIDPDGLNGTTAYMLSPLADEGTIEKLEKNIGEDVRFVCDSNQFIYCVIPIFQFGKDNLSFTNTHTDFFNISECIVWEKEDAEANGKFNPLPGFVRDTMKDVGGVNTGTQISNEAFGRLISGMSNTVVHRINAQKNDLWGGSCYGMAQVMAIRYLDPERLPLSEIDSSLNNMNSTFDLQAPKDSETTENLINYYSLSRFLPVNYLQIEKRGDEIAKDYTKSLESLVSTIKKGIPVSVCIALCDENGKHKGSSHDVILLDILGENEECYGVKVCDPNETEYTTMRIYKQPGIEPEAFAIEYYTDSGYYNMLPTYYSSLEEMDLRNYFGLDDNAGWLTDYDQNILVVRLDSSVSFTSDNVTLQYKDGVVLNRENISSPYIIPNTMVDGTDASEAEFLFEKSSKDSVSSLSVSSETGYVDTTLILDGWSAAIRSENAISVQANSQNQSVSIQSEDAGMISLLLTRNETAEDWPWYGIAVDVDDATELTVTPTDAGIQISSDNLDGAAVAGQSKDNIDSLTLNTNSKTVLLVNKTPSDSDNDHIDIIVEDVTVTFDPNGGTVTPVSAITGEDGTLSSLPVPTRDGYTFNGWYSAPSGGNKITSSTVFTTDTTVYAQWSKETSGSSDNGSSSASTYTISTSATENGSVSVSPKSARAGTTVTVTATPDDGYELDKLTVTDKNGNSIKLTDQGNGKYTFTMPASKVSVAASFIALEVPAPTLPFTDVAASDWFYDAVAYVYANGLMTGTSDTTFSPNATTTRGMIVTILHRLEGTPTADASGFTDVEKGAWYQDAVDWAAANGIVNGTSQTTFAPNAPITREQMAAILYRYAAYKGYDVSQKADLSKYQDQGTIGAYAKDSMAWANAAGLITGVTDTTLSPRDSAIRAQTATILMRFCEGVAK